MEFKGTPGPWRKYQLPNGNMQITSDSWRDFSLVEFVHPVANTDERRRQCLFNAKLISKAPEMLEMLKECVEVIDWFMGNTTPHNDDYPTFFNLGANAIELSKKLIHEATNI